MNSLSPLPSPDAPLPTRGPFTYQEIPAHGDEPVNFRIADSDDCRVATCYNEGNAKMVVRLLNLGAAPALPVGRAALPSREQLADAILASLTGGEPPKEKYKDDKH